MLAQYAKDNGFGNVEYYVDDGISGTTFIRDDFQRLMGDVEDGKVGVVITKDLSRLGRNYLEAGRHREIFAEYGVRFIAIGDNYDSQNDDGSDIATPIKEIIHEFYAKDCSRKMRAALKTKAQNGGFVLGLPPYGYSRVAGTTNRLEPNEETAPIARRMFQMAIVVYTGCLVCLRYTTKSFKDNSILKRPEDEWIITENTHVALVSEEVFNTVQTRISCKQQLLPNDLNTLRGLVFCSDCGSRLGFHVIKNRPIKELYRCTRNQRYGKRDCTTHNITFDQVETVVLNDIRKHAGLAAENIKEYTDYLISISESKINGEKASFQKEADKSEKRLTEIDTLIQKMYEDKVFGVISSERFIAMTAALETEQKTLKTRYAELSDYLKGQAKKTKSANDFAELISKYTDITELDSELANTLLERLLFTNGKRLIREQY